MESGQIKVVDALKASVTEIRAHHAKWVGGVKAMSVKIEIGEATLRGMLEGRNSQIESVEKVASYFGFEAWQLLAPGFKFKSPPSLSAADPTKIAKTDEEAQLILSFRSVGPKTKAKALSKLKSQAKEFADYMSGTSDPLATRTAQSKKS